MNWTKKGHFGKIKKKIVQQS